MVETGEKNQVRAAGLWKDSGKIPNTFECDFQPLTIAGLSIPLTYQVHNEISLMSILN